MMAAQQADTPELSRPVPVRALPAQTVTITASEAECAALATRFDIPAVKRLEATLDVVADGDAILVSGTMTAGIVQDCAVAHEPFDTAIEEAVSLRFVLEQAGHPGGSGIRTERGRTGRHRLHRQHHRSGRSRCANAGPSHRPLRHQPRRRGCARGGRPERRGCAKRSAGGSAEGVVEGVGLVEIGVGEDGR